MLSVIVDQYVIKENQHKPSKKCLEDVIHEALEGCQGIIQAKDITLNS